MLKRSLFLVSALLLFSYESEAQTPAFEACEAVVEATCQAFGAPAEKIPICTPYLEVCPHYPGVRPGSNTASFVYNCLYTHPAYPGTKNYYAGIIGSCTYTLPTETIDLEVTSVEVRQDALETLDGLFALLPDKDLEVIVKVKGTGIPSGDARSANLVVSIGSSQFPISIPFSELSLGEVAKSIPHKFAFADLGYKELRASIASAVVEANTTNNTKFIESQVYCSATKVNGSVVDWKQFQSPWGTSSDKFMAQNGCAVTSVAMLLSKYGLNKDDKGQNFNPGTFYEGLKSFEDFNGKSVSGLAGKSLKWPMAALYAQVGFKRQCTDSGGNDAQCTSEAKDKIKLKPRLLSDKILPGLAESLCAGSPVTIRVPGITNTSKDHFVLALSTTVTNKQLHIVTNDPGRSVASFKYKFEDLRSAEVYKQEKDPAMLFIYLSGGSGMIVTDPNGRKVGKNTITNEVFNEIPDATYFLDNGIDDLDLSDGDDSGEPILEFSLPDNVLPGQYKVEVFGGVSGTYSLSIDGYDNEGQPNAEIKTSGSLNVGELASFDYIQVNETDEPLNASIKTANLIILEKPKKNEDRFIWYGQIRENGAPKNKALNFNNYFKIEIDGSSIEVPRNQFKSFGAGQMRYYSYTSKLYGGLTVKILTNGLYYIHLRNSPELPSNQIRLGLTIDNLSGQSVIKLKCKNKICKN